MKKTSLFLTWVSLLIVIPVTVSGLELVRVVWNKKMLIRDRLEQNGGKATSLFCFDAALGEFFVEVNNVDKSIVSFSGVFRNLDGKVFQFLEQRKNSIDNTPGLKNVELRRSNYPNTGKEYLALKMDVNTSHISLSDQSYFSLIRSKDLQVKLELKMIGESTVGLSVGLEFGDGMFRYHTPVVGWIELWRKPPESLFSL